MKKAMVVMILAAGIGGLAAFSQEPQSRRVLAEELLVLMKLNKTMELSQKLMVKLMPKIQAMEQEYKCAPQPAIPKPAVKE